MLIPVCSGRVQPTTSGGAAPSFTPGPKVEAWCYTAPGGVSPMQGKRTYTVNADGSISNEVFLDNAGAPLDPTTVLKVPCVACPCEGVASTPVTPTPVKESDGVLMCDNGVEFLRWYLKSDGTPFGTPIDTDKLNNPYTVTDESKVTVGACLVACAPATYEGVLPEFGGGGITPPAVVAPSGLSYTDPACTNGGASTTVTPTLTSNGGEAVTYSISPTTDVSIDPATGVVTYTPA